MNLKILFIEIYLDYGELLNTNLLTADGRFKVMNTKHYNFLKRKLQEDNFFRTLLNSFSLSQSLSKLCLLMNFTVLFIEEDSDLKKSFESSILKK